jgi:hypothetical protein
MIPNKNNNKLPLKINTSYNLYLNISYNLYQKVSTGVGWGGGTKQDAKGGMTLFEPANLFRTRRI